MNKNKFVYYQKNSFFPLLILLINIFVFDLAESKTLKIPVVSKVTREAGDFDFRFSYKFIDHKLIEYPSHAYEASFDDVLFQNEDIVVCYGQCSEDQSIQGLNSNLILGKKGGDYEVQLRTEPEVESYIEGLPVKSERVEDENEFVNQLGNKFGLSGTTMYNLLEAEKVGKLELAAAFQSDNATDILNDNFKLLSLSNVYYWLSILIKDMKELGFQLSKRIIVKINPTELDCGGFDGAKACFSYEDSNYPQEYGMLFLVNDIDYDEDFWIRMLYSHTSPPSSLDPMVIAHELGHGYFGENVKYVYINNQVSIINEAFAYYFAMNYFNTPIMGGISNNSGMDEDVSGFASIGDIFHHYELDDKKVPHNSARILNSIIWYLRGLTDDPEIIWELYLKSIYELNKYPFITYLDFANEFMENGELLLKDYIRNKPSIQQVLKEVGNIEEILNDRESKNIPYEISQRPTDLLLEPAKEKFIFKFHIRDEDKARKKGYDVLDYSVVLFDIKRYESNLKGYWILFSLQTQSPEVLDTNMNWLYFIYSTYGGNTLFLDAYDEDLNRISNLEESLLEVLNKAYTGSAIYLAFMNYMIFESSVDDFWDLAAQLLGKKSKYLGNDYNRNYSEEEMDDYEYDKRHMKAKKHIFEFKLTEEAKEDIIGMESRGLSKYFINDRYPPEAKLILTSIPKKFKSRYKMKFNWKNRPFIKIELFNDDFKYQVSLEKEKKQ
ncbi:MAG: hypothetical protein ABIA04_01515 [Pseudomonadota bacterium]